MKTKKSGDITYYTAAGGVLVDETGAQILLLIRPSRDEVRLPKGHVEEGETLKIAALREVIEESGYSDVVILDTLGEQLVAFQFKGKQVQRTEYFFLMRTRTNQQRPRPAEDEHQFFTTWVDWNEADEYMTFESEREWIKRAYVAFTKL